MWEVALGDEHPNLAYALTGVGKSLSSFDRHEEAVVQLERALALRLKHGVGRSLLAKTRLALAEALWNAAEAKGGDRPRARRLAQDVLIDYAGDNKAEMVKRASVGEWLEAHPRR